MSREAREWVGGFMGEGSYFSDPSWTPERVGAFFAAARALWELRPWTRVDDDELVLIEALELGIDDGCVSIVGAAGEVRGFVFFPSYEDYERMTEGELASHEGVYFSFDRSEDVAPGMRAEVAQHGWPLADDDTYPVLLRLVEGKPAPVLERELRLAIAIMTGLVALMERHPAAFEPYGEDDISESHIEDGLELTLSVPHPLVLAAAEGPPRAPTLSADEPYGLPLTPSERKQLARALGAFSLHRVIGVFCAVASVPRVPPTQLWLGAILSELKLADQQAAQLVVGLLMKVYNHVVATLAQSSIDELVPESADAEACRDWARGYGTLLAGVEPAAFEDDALECVLTIQLVAELPAALAIAREREGEDGNEEDMIAFGRESLADDAAYLFDCWAKARAMPSEPVRREGPKLGRNDPCSCGSGKKYKKCCGAAS